jgi:hypothetical protein
VRSAGSSSRCGMRSPGPLDPWPSDRAADQTPRRWDSIAGKHYYEIVVTDEGLCRVGWSTRAGTLELGAPCRRHRSPCRSALNV